MEHAEGLVILGKITLALQDMNLNGGLVVGCGRENLTLLVGIVVFLSIILVITPPIVSTPSDNGVTSRSSNPLRRRPKRRPAERRP